LSGTVSLAEVPVRGVGGEICWHWFPHLKGQGQKTLQTNMLPLCCHGNCNKTMGI